MCALFLLVRANDFDVEILGRVKTQEHRYERLELKINVYSWFGLKSIVQGHDQGNNSLLAVQTATTQPSVHANESIITQLAIWTWEHRDMSRIQ